MTAMLSPPRVEALGFWAVQKEEETLSYFFASHVYEGRKGGGGRT